MFIYLHDDGSVQITNRIDSVKQTRMVPETLTVRFFHLHRLYRSDTLYNTSRRATQLLQFVKGSAGRMVLLGGPVPARGPQLADPWCRHTTSETFRQGCAMYIRYQIWNVASGEWDLTAQMLWCFSASAQLRTLEGTLWRSSKSYSGGVSTLEEFGGVSKS